jgi:lysyl-tRNA synthetase class 2
MTERSGPGPGAPTSGDGERPAGPVAIRPPDRRHQRRWVPVVAGWLALLIGLADVIEGAVPSLYAHYRLHRIFDLAPGTLTNLTRTADVLTGLLLLMLSHGLRRRKRRACRAVILLLIASAVIHLAH